MVICRTNTRRVRRPAVALGQLVLLTVAGMALSGCGVDLGYLLPAAAGQIRLVWSSVSIADAIEQGSLTEDQVAKLELIRDARAYARDVIGLNVANNFTKFYDSGGEPVAFNVSACRKDAFEPRVWWFPIIGTIPYLGFFDRAAADAKFEELVEQGFDVFRYEIEAYSGIGFFPNIVLSPMLERSETTIVQTVFHELLHSTVWRQSDTSFNESLGTFYGRTGASAYLAERYPDQPEIVQEAVERFEDGDRYTDFMLTLFNELDAFYSSDLSSEEKIAGREAVFQAGGERFAAEVQPLMHRPERFDWVQDLPPNNAWMLGIRRYNLDLGVFEQVFFATGEDWSASLEVFKEAARHSDPYGYLLAWLSPPEDAKRVTSSKTGAAPADQERASTRQRPSRGPCPTRLPTTLLCPE